MRHVLLIGAFSGAMAWAQTKPAAPAPGETSPAEPQAAQQPAQQTPQAEQQAAQQALAQKPPEKSAVQSAMAESIAKQRAAVMKQVASVMGKAPKPVASFFTVPWVESPAPFNMPPCDPVPAAELDKLVQENSQQQGVKEDLIRGVIAEESAGRPCAVSWKGAQGLMQLMPATAEQFGVTDPFDPRQSVEAGTKLLKQLLTKYNNDVSLALAAYNAGEGRVDKDGGVPQIPETQNYVNDIQSKLPKK